MKLKLFSFLALVIVITVLSVIDLSAQEMCPVKSFEIKSVAGHVFENGKKRQPIADTLIELFRIQNTDSLISSVRTDNQGGFKFDRLKKGKYRLRVHFLVRGEKVGPRFDLILKVTKSNSSNPLELIEITLGPDCFTSDAKISKDS